MIYSLRCGECSFESIDKQKFDNHLRKSSSSSSVVDIHSHGATYSLFICSECSACSTSRAIIEEHQVIYHSDASTLQQRKPMRVIESRETFARDDLAQSPEKMTDTSEDRGTVKDSTSSVDSSSNNSCSSNTEQNTKLLANSMTQDCLICRCQLPGGQSSLVEHFKTMHNLPMNLISRFLPVPKEFEEAMPAYREPRQVHTPWQNLFGQLHETGMNKFMQQPASSTPEKSPNSGVGGEKMNQNVLKFLSDFLQTSMRQANNSNSETTHPVMTNPLHNGHASNKLFIPQAPTILQSQPPPTTIPGPMNPQAISRNNNKRSFFSLDNIMTDFMRKSQANNQPIDTLQQHSIHQPIIDGKRKKMDFDQLLARHTKTSSLSRKHVTTTTTNLAVEEDDVEEEIDDHSQAKSDHDLNNSDQTSNNNNTSGCNANSTITSASTINGVVHNTMRKTKSDMKVIQRYIIQTKHDSRDIHDMPPEELNQYVKDFIVTAKKKDGHEYEPESLKAFVHSLERHLKYHNYPYSVLKDNAFQGIRNVLNQRLHELRSLIRTSTSNINTDQAGHNGSGDRETGKSSDGIGMGEMAEGYHHQAYHKAPTGASLMRDNLLGVQNPQALLNSLWLMNRTQFNIGGTQRHRNLIWGQYNLIANDSVIQFNSMNNNGNERTNQSDIRYCRGHGGSGNNTAMGSNLNNNQASNLNKILTVQMQPIQCTGSGKRLPMPFNCVEVFQMYAKLRPIQMNGPNEPFYLCPDPNWEHGGAWFKPIGAGTQIISRIPRMLGLKPSRDVQPVQSKVMTSNSLNNNPNNTIPSQGQQHPFNMPAQTTFHPGNIAAADYFKSLLNASNNNNNGPSALAQCNNPNSIDSLKNFAKIFLSKSLGGENDENTLFPIGPLITTARSLANESGEQSDDGHCSSVNQPNSFDEDAEEEEEEEDVADHDEDEEEDDEDDVEEVDENRETFPGHPHHHSSSSSSGKNLHDQRKENVGTIV